jgi:hypothetical protein
LFYALLRRELGPGLKFKRLFWIGVAATGMGLILFFVRDVNIFAAAAIGGLGYLIMVWLLPTFSMDERGQLLNVVNRVTRRLRPAVARG